MMEIEIEEMMIYYFCVGGVDDEEMMMMRCCVCYLLLSIYCVLIYYPLYAFSALSNISDCKLVFLVWRPGCNG